MPTKRKTFGKALSDLSNKIDRIKYSKTKKKITVSQLKKLYTEYNRLQSLAVYREVVHPLHPKAKPVRLLDPRKASKLKGVLNQLRTLNASRRVKRHKVKGK